MHSPGGGGVRGQLWFCDLVGVLAVHGEMRLCVCVRLCLPVCISSEYTIMAESLERCFSRALLKHFPAEDGDTDEEFHVSSEDRDRKDKKKSKSHKQSGPESLIRATEQVQKHKTSNSGKGNNQQQDKPKFALQYPPPHYTNGPPHPHNIHPGQQQAGMLHPAQQVRLHSLHKKKMCIVDS